MVATSREKRQSIKRHFHYRNQHSSFEMANWVKILLISLDFNGKTRKCYPKMLLGAQFLSTLFWYDIITIQGGNFHAKYFPSFLVISIGKITSGSQGQTSSGPLFRQQSQSWGWLGDFDKSIVDETNCTGENSFQQKGVYSFKGFWYVALRARGWAITANTWLLCYK